MYFSFPRVSFVSLFNFYDRTKYVKNVCFGFVSRHIHDDFYALLCFPYLLHICTKILICI